MMSQNDTSAPTPRAEFGVQIGDKVEQHTASGFAFSEWTATNRANYLNRSLNSVLDDVPAHVVTRQVTITDWTVYQPAAVAS